MGPEILTVGHSNRTLEDFLAILSAHRVERLVDVRSVPWSRRWPWFRRRELARALAAAGVDYLWLGDALGGKKGAGPTRPGALDTAVARVTRLAASRRLALMCAEADPARCHRAHLLAPAFEHAGARVVHLLDARRTECHAETAARTAPPSPVVRDLFAS